MLDAFDETKLFIRMYLGFSKPALKLCILVMSKYEKEGKKTYKSKESILKNYYPPLGFGCDGSKTSLMHVGKVIMHICKYKSMWARTLYIYKVHWLKEKN